jgi:hypothetical protein
MTRKLSYTIALFALLLGSAVPRAVAAGPNNQHEIRQVELFIESVAHEWRMAFEQSMRASNTEVRSKLIQARSMIDQARSLHRQRRLNEAKRKAEAARTVIRATWSGRSLAPKGNFGYRAGSGVVRLNAGGNTFAENSFVENSIDKTEQMISRLVELGPLGPHGRNAESLLQQAREAHASGQSERSERLGALAQTQGNLAWQDVMQSLKMQRESVALEATVAPLVDRARRLAASHGDVRMVAIADRATGHVDLARQVDARNQGSQKARLLQTAMHEAELVLRTLDRTEFARRRAERSVAQAAGAIGRAAEVVQAEIVQEDGDAGDATQLLIQGRALLVQAREAIRTGDTESARSHAEGARRIAQRVIGAVLGQLTPTGVAEAIARTDQLLGGAMDVGGRRSRELLGVAISHQAQARELLEQGNLPQALARTRIAARLSQRAHELDR